MRAISIHTSLTRRDFQEIKAFNQLEISIHTSLTRRDLTSPDSSTLSVFQSTRLLRDVTGRWARRNNRLDVISIHTSLTRRDKYHQPVIDEYNKFQSTRLLRDVT